MNLPQIRQQPWYPGQFGVAGSDVQRGLRWEPAGIVLYVDDNHPGATAVGDGTDPEQPLTTIQTAVNNLTAFATAMAISLEGSVIVVADESTIAESVIVPATAPTNCTIMGSGATAHHPTWTAATAAGTALTLRQEGWTVEGFTFEVGTAGTAVRLDEVPASSYTAYKTTIRNCRFDGLWGGLYGVDFHGAPHRVLIENCEFLEFRRGDTTAYAVIVSDSAHTNPYECHMHGNVFWENENHVGSLGGLRAWNLSTFTGNTFHEGVLIPSTLMLDLRGGTRGENIVTGNVFCGDYSNTGGYYANAANPGMWVGNFAEDVAEAEVADNGLTIAPPAA
jgi:hypothetical protein